MTGKLKEIIILFKFEKYKTVILYYTSLQSIEIYMQLIVTSKK